MGVKICTWENCWYSIEPVDSIRLQTCVHKNSSCGQLKGYVMFSFILEHACSVLFFNYECFITEPIPFIYLF